MRFIQSFVQIVLSTNLAALNVHNYGCTSSLFLVHPKQLSDAASDAGYYSTTTERQSTEVSI